MVLSIPKRHKGKKLYVELWKDIIDYEGLYQISNLGRVKNSRTGRILKSRKGCIKLCKNGEGKKISINKLVFSHFKDIDKISIIDFLENNINNRLDKPLKLRLKELLHLDLSKDMRIINNRLKELYLPYQLKSTPIHGIRYWIIDKL